MARLIINKKTLLIIDAVLILGSLISIALIIGYTQPFAVAPLPAESKEFLFSLPKTDFILLDDSTKFDSPKTIFINDIVVLEKGRYFIKFFDGLKSEIRQIDLETDAALKFEQSDNEIRVLNAGKSSLQIESYDKGSLIGFSGVNSGGNDE